MDGTISILVGATASGKTAVVARLAGLMTLGRGGVAVEAVSADSRQVYRRLDIGTAKPTPAERALVPHHLIDVVDPGDTYSAGRYRRAAEAAISEVLSRGGMPIVVGGTGFYVRALAEGLSRIPPVPAEVTEALREELRVSGLPVLRRLLVEADPVAAEGIAPGDPQRTVRALAVWRHTARPLSDWWREPPQAPRYRYTWFGIRRSRDELRSRIAERVDAMIAAGLESEVRELAESGVGWESSAMRTVGYREWRPYIEGEESIESVRDAIVTHTAQYAKRQMTWFRSVSNLHWIDVPGDDAAEVLRKHVDTAGHS